MKEFLEYLIKHIVDKPDDVIIHEIKGNQIIVFELHVGEGDIGKVIGKHGRTVQSLRTLLEATAAKRGKRFLLEILENEKQLAISQ